MFSSARVLLISLLVAFLALGGCQTAPPKGLSPAQVAVLKQQGFELTDEGWAFGLSGKVLFGSDVETLNQPSTDIVQRIGKALLGVGMKEENIQLRGLGSAEPVASNATAAGRTENRRVSIVVIAD